MILDTLDEIPFTMVWKRLADEEETLVLITVVVDTLSFTLEVRMLLVADIVFDIGIEEVGIVREAFVRFRFPVITVLPERVEDADIKLLVFVVVDTDNVFPEITEVVATTPLTLVVRVLPVTL